jgi:hypothetical protein
VLAASEKLVNFYQTIQPSNSEDVLCTMRTWDPTWGSIVNLFTYKPDCCNKEWIVWGGHSAVTGHLYSPDISIHQSWSSDTDANSITWVNTWGALSLSAECITESLSKCWTSVWSIQLCTVTPHIFIFCKHCVTSVGMYTAIRQFANHKIKV